jgi:hypothetical protein
MHYSILDLKGFSPALSAKFLIHHKHKFSHISGESIKNFVRRDRMDYTLYSVAIPVIVVAAIGWLLYKRTAKTTDKTSGFGTVATILEPGWQLFPRLTSGEAK